MALAIIGKVSGKQATPAIIGKASGTRAILATTARGQIVTVDPEAIVALATIAKEIESATDPALIM